MKINRRRFIFGSVLVGGGALFTYSATRPSRHRQANVDLAQGEERYITSFIKIEPSNEITIYLSLIHI